MNERRRLFQDNPTPKATLLSGEHSASYVQDEGLRLASKSFAAKETLAKGKSIVAETQASSPPKFLAFNMKASEALLKSSPYSRASPEVRSSFYAPNSPILSSLLNQTT